MNTTKKAFEISGITFNEDVPASAEAWDEAIGSAGHCVSSAIENHAWRGFAAPVRAAIVKALEEAGHKRKATGTKAGKDVLETPDTFIKRLLADKSLTKAEYNSLGQAAVQSKGITFMGTLSNTGRSDIGQKWLDSAQELQGYWEAGVGPTGDPSSVEGTLAKLRSVLPDAELTNESTTEQIAYVLRDYSNELSKLSVA